MSLSTDIAAQEGGVYDQDGSNGKNAYDGWVFQVFYSAIVLFLRILAPVWRETGLG
jgi:hypothetical protein